MGVVRSYMVHGIGVLAYEEHELMLEIDRDDSGRYLDFWCLTEN